MGNLTYYKVGQNYTYLSGIDFYFESATYIQARYESTKFPNFNRSAISHGVPNANTFKAGQYNLTEEMSLTQPVAYFDSRNNLQALRLEEVTFESERVTEIKPVLLIPF